MIRAIRVNPGGRIDPYDCMGRDDFIAGLLQDLQRQSIVLVAGRRSGKTSILEKMRSEAKADQLIIFRNVEAVNAPLEFVEQVFEAIKPYLSANKRFANKFLALFKQLGGAGAWGFNLPQTAAPQYKVLLESLLGDLAEQNHHVILLWDELPWMLQKIVKQHGQAVAVDLLDCLRSLRQNRPNLRMLYTGSIGLHHVIGTLTAEGFNNSPLNDMKTIELPSLTDEDATKLTLGLFKGENIQCSQPQQCAERLAQLADNVPFYIHHIVAQLLHSQQPITPNIIVQIVQQAIVDARDPLQLSYYRTRLKNYYQGDAALARTIMDIFAASQPLTQSQLMHKLDDNLPGQNNTGVREMLRALQRDKYLIKDPTTEAYRYSSTLIRRWWRTYLGLVEHE